MNLSQISLLSLRSHEVAVAIQDLQTVFNAHWTALNNPIGENRL